MRRMLSIVSAGVLIAGLSLLPAGAQPSPKATGGANYLTLASGVEYESHVSFVAMGTPDAAKGQVQAKNQGTGGADWHGVVDCYDQNGNEAWLSGRITNFRPGAEDSGATGFFQVSVVDNGEPGVADMISARRADEAFDCEDRQSAMRTLTGGNIQVHE